MEESIKNYNYNKLIKSQVKKKFAATKKKNKEQFLAKLSKNSSLDGISTSTKTNNQICRNAAVYVRSVKSDLPPQCRLSSNHHSRERDLRPKHRARASPSRSVTSDVDANPTSPPTAARAPPASSTNFTDSI
ncbi:hypothetical protein TIFTF001_001664 [Ficus carica]|uniref:Uncharacterized protein n=1 Tax=Ficus carica TaxID=3494 RepID=A0AA87Z0D5_FICCA|nr:hypothetical protein TIFTF001_001664 [Ficus carica]